MLRVPIHGVATAGSLVIEVVLIEAADRAEEADFDFRRLAHVHRLVLDLPGTNETHMFSPECCSLERITR